MNNTELLYKKINFLRVEVHGSIVDDIKSTVDALVAENKELDEHLTRRLNDLDDVKKQLRPLSDMTMDELIDFIHIGQPDVDAQYHEFEEVLNDIRKKGIEAFDFSDCPPALVFKQVEFLNAKGFDLGTSSNQHYEAKQ